MCLFVDVHVFEHSQGKLFDQMMKVVRLYLNYLLPIFDLKCSLFGRFGLEIFQNVFTYDWSIRWTQLVNWFVWTYVSLTIFAFFLHSAFQRFALLRIWTHFVYALKSTVLSNSFEGSSELCFEKLFIVEDVFQVLLRVVVKLS